MTTSTAPIPSSSIAAPSGRRVARRVLISLVVLLAAVAALAVGFAFGYGRAHDQRAMSGVHVGGVDVSGMDRSTAEAAIRAELPSLSAGSLVVRVGQDEARIDYAGVGRDYDVDRMLDAAFAIGRSGDLFAQPLDQVRALTDGASISTAARHDSEALERELARVAGVLAVQPVDASVTLEASGFSVAPSADGRRVDIDALRSAVLATLTTVDPADRVLESSAIVVAPRHPTADVLRAVADAEGIAASGLRLTLPGSEAPLELTGQSLREWIRFEAAESGLVVRLDQAKVPARIEALAPQVARSPVDAAVDLAPGAAAFAVSPAKDGRALDVDASAARVVDALSARAAGQTVPAVELAFTVVPPTVSTDAAHAASLAAEAVSGRDLTLTAGPDAATIAAADLRRATRFQVGASGSYVPSIDPEALTTTVSEASQPLVIEARSAGFRFRGSSGSVAVTPAQVGRTVDVAASMARIRTELGARGQGKAAAAVALTTERVAPDFSTAEANAAAGRVTKISEWTTRYPVGPNNGYGANIRIPAQILNGYVVEPGVTFDFWREIGGVSREKGYKPGAMIQGGTTVEPGEIGPDGAVVEGALAGGICSASTTLFNAALRAGFPIETRRNHYYYISRYPLGLDATVWRNGSRIQTMRWTNDTPWPVLIRGVNGDGWVRFELHTVPVGRRVTLADPVVTDEEEAADSIVFTRTLSPGRTRRAEKPHDGFRVSVTRTVRAANGDIIRKDRFSSRYGTVRGVLLVGGEGRDRVFPPGVTAHWP